MPSCFSPIDILDITDYTFIRSRMYTRSCCFFIPKLRHNILNQNSLIKLIWFLACSPPFIYSVLVNFPHIFHYCIPFTVSIQTIVHAGCSYIPSQNLAIGLPVLFGFTLLLRQKIRSWTCNWVMALHLFSRCLKQTVNSHFSTVSHKGISEGGARICNAEQW